LNHYGFVTLIYSYTLVQEFIESLTSKILVEMGQQQTEHRREKWLADLAIGSIHLKEGNTFAR
jgi:hypothetical protein